MKKPPLTGGFFLGKSRIIKKATVLWLFRGVTIILLKFLQVLREESPLHSFSSS